MRVCYYSSSTFPPFFCIMFTFVDTCPSPVHALRVRIPSAHPVGVSPFGVGGSFSAFADVFKSASPSATGLTPAENLPIGSGAAADVELPVFIDCDHSACTLVRHGVRRGVAAPQALKVIRWEDPTTTERKRAALGEGCAAPGKKRFCSGLTVDIAAANMTDKESLPAPRHLWESRDAVESSGLDCKSLEMLCSALEIPFSVVSDDDSDESGIDSVEDSDDESGIESDDDWELFVSVQDGPRGSVVTRWRQGTDGSFTKLAVQPSVCTN